MKPICCNKPATPYKKLYGGYIYKKVPYGHETIWVEDLSTEEGFRCRKCGRYRIPYITDTSNFLPFAPFSDEQLKIYFDNLQNEGIIFIYEAVKCSYRGSSWVW